MVPSVLRDCVATGNRDVHIFSAGFGETGEEEGIALQYEIAQIALDGGLRVIGPNSMGIFSPGRKLVTWSGAPTAAGSVGLLTQSGGFADAAIGYGTQLGLSFSTVVNYGSGLTVDASDLIGYLSEDPETDAIGVYLEGIADGRHLLDVVTSTTPRKPIFIMKPRSREAARAGGFAHRISGRERPNLAGLLRANRRGARGLGPRHGSRHPWLQTAGSSCGPEGGNHRDGWRQQCGGGRRVEPGRARAPGALGRKR